MKKINKTIYLITILLMELSGCTSHIPRQSEAGLQPPTLTTPVIGQVLTQMTEVMIHDITNPPLAARFFSYACLAGYEVVAQNNSSFKSMHGC
jgi:hypothetical protein